MANTGYLIYTKLIKVSDDLEQVALDVNNVPTSISGLPQDTKDNVFGQPDYVPKVFNSGSCPVTAYTAIREQSFIRNNCGAFEEGTSVLFTKTYVSYISQQDANNKASIDPLFASEGQQYANQNGTCQSIGTVYVTINIIPKNPQTGVANEYYLQLSTQIALQESIYLTTTLHYTNQFSQPSSKMISVLLNPGDLTSQFNSYDITDGSPADDDSQFYLTETTVNPADGSIVHTYDTHSPKVLSVSQGW